MTVIYTVYHASHTVPAESFGVKSVNGLAGLQSIVVTGLLMLDLSGREKSSFASDNVGKDLLNVCGHLISTRKRMVVIFVIEEVSKFASS